MFRSLLLIAGLFSVRVLRLANSPLIFIRFLILAGLGPDADFLIKANRTGVKGCSRKAGRVLFVDKFGCGLQYQKQLNLSHRDYLCSLGKGTETLIILRLGF